MRCHVIIAVARPKRRAVNRKRQDKARDDRRLMLIWHRAHEDVTKQALQPARRRFLSHRHQLRDSQLLSQGESATYIAKLLEHKAGEMRQRNDARWIEEGKSPGVQRPSHRHAMEHLVPACENCTNLGQNRTTPNVSKRKRPSESIT